MVLQAGQPHPPRPLPPTAGSARRQGSRDPARGHDHATAPLACPGPQVPALPLPPPPSSHFPGLTCSRSRGKPKTGSSRLEAASLRAEGEFDARRCCSPLDPAARPSGSPLRPGGRGRPEGDRDRRLSQARPARCASANPEPRAGGASAAQRSTDPAPPRRGGVMAPPLRPLKGPRPTVSGFVELEG